ncbi:restriction endonuclease subunit S [Chryseobacterium sp. X308]|uniref:restriction endonuclease subunit S n=1 Tax=Chryseobacterium sp. X308 TaxID=2884873 RepID=UPI001D14FB1F|nr:restriction endonuclease subunit S [Chryseobacterium sp. X308]MCC3214839.1 restriction endonuclease subunit S [Chryseobacterium sp. X308]
MKEHLKSQDTEKEFFTKISLQGIDVQYESIGNLISRVREKGKHNNNIATVYSVSNFLGLVKAEDFRNNTIHSSDLSNYTIVKPGMFAYNPARLNIGSIGYLKNDLSGLVSPMYVVFEIDENRITKEYLYLFIKSKYCINKISSLTEAGARFRFDFERWSLIKIPLPSIILQKEIVRILDIFTKHIDELTAELIARKQQYNYYRKQLLSFEEKNVEWKPLRNLAENLDSMRKPVTGGLRESGNIPYYGASGIVDYVKDYIFDGDFLLVSEDGANLIARNTPIAFSISGKSWVNNHAHVLKFNTYAERKFVEYFLNSIDLAPYISGAAQPKLNQKNLNSIKIPSPSPEVKEKIVSILDKFDTLTTSVNEGLPKEIELRQKQYEYYRDMLLTFPKDNLDA